MTDVLKALAAWLVFILVPGMLCVAEERTIAVGPFSDMTAGEPVIEWEAMTFARIESHTRYALVSLDGRTVLRADSHASSSGLAKKVTLDPAEYPILTWDWKVNNTITKGDVTRKSGDDYAARIYITFADDPGQLSFFERVKKKAIDTVYGKGFPDSALAYIWGNRAAVESIHPNPYTSRVQMVVVESGASHLYRWRSARRDISADYRRAFGTDPPPITGIAVMTDTDDTGESATAWYGDVTFWRR